MLPVSRAWHIQSVVMTMDEVDGHDPLRSGGIQRAMIQTAKGSLPKVPLCACPCTCGVRGTLLHGTALLSQPSLAPNLAFALAH